MRTIITIALIGGASAVGWQNRGKIGSMMSKKVDGKETAEIMHQLEDTKQYKKLFSRPEVFLSTHQKCVKKALLEGYRKDSRVDIERAKQSCRSAGA